MLYIHIYQRDTPSPESEEDLDLESIFIELLVKRKGKLNIILVLTQIMN